MPFARQCEFAAALGYDGLESRRSRWPTSPHLDRAGAGRDSARHAEDGGARDHRAALAAGRAEGPLDRQRRRRGARAHRRVMRAAGRPLCRSDGRAATWCTGLPASAGAAGRLAARPRSRAHGSASPRGGGGRTRGVDLLHRAARGERDRPHQHRRRSGGDSSIRSAARACRRWSTACAAGQASRAGRSVLMTRWMPDRPHRPRAGQRPQSPRARARARPRSRRSFAALQTRRPYDGVVAVEPFDYVPDGATCAARSLGYVRGILEAL